MQTFKIHQRPTPSQNHSNRYGIIDRSRIAIALFLLTFSFISISCAPNSSENTTKSPTEKNVLNLWWDKGFSLEEDEALQQLVSKWERQSGIDVKLFFQTPDELLQKAQRAIASGNPPDVLYSDIGSSALFPRFAWEGKLADISEAIAPVKHLYPPSVLESIYLYNNVAKKRSYYALPIQQSAIHIFYWRDLLKKTGRTESDIPKNWDTFWEFWQQVRNDLHSSQTRNIYSLGLTMSVGSADTNYLFEQILEAYDVRIVDSRGKLQVDDPKIRQRLIQVLDWYARLYRQQYVPPDAVKWLSTDNNINLLNRSVLLTPNATLSIPVSQRSASETYRKLGTLEFPNKPNGKPMRHLVIVRQAVVLKASKNQKAAKEFLTYLAQPETLADYIKQSGGRYFPVMMPAWEDPFWTDANDPHISAATKTLLEHPTRPFYTAQNPAYSQLQEQHVWGGAIDRMIVGGVSAEQAADETIETIKQIFSAWQ